MTKFERKALNDKYVKQIAGITDGEGLKLAFGTNDGLYQHYNKLLHAGTKDFPTDHIDDLKLQTNDTLNITKRGRDADMYYRSHHEIDTYCYRPQFGWKCRFGIGKTI